MSVPGTGDVQGDVTDIISLRTCRADGDVQGDVTPYTVTVTLVWGMEAEAEAVVCIAGHWKMSSRVHSRCVCVCVRARARVCVCVCRVHRRCVCVCVCWCGHVYLYIVHMRILAVTYGISLYILHAYETYYMSQ